MFHFYLTSVTITSLLAGSFERLYCYNCVYSETKLPPVLNSTVPSDITCKSGHSPNDSLIVNCDCLQYYKLVQPNDVTIFYPASVVENESKLLATQINTVGSFNGWTFTCAKFVFNGTFKGGPYRSTVRTCIPRRFGQQAPFQEICNNGTLLNVVRQRQDQEVKLALGNYMAILDYNNTQTVACTCNDGVCNGALRMTPFALFIKLVLFPIILALT